MSAGDAWGYGALMRTLLVALVALLVLPATASASMVDEAVDVAQTFWLERSVQPCPDPLVAVVEEPGPNADGAADLGGCRVWLRTGLVDLARREHYNPNAGGDSQREILCATVVHELGHTAGLTHTDNGIMSADGYVIPWACVQWRRSLDRQDRRLAESASSKRVHHAVRVSVERARWRVHGKRQGLRLVIPRSLVD